MDVFEGVIVPDFAGHTQTNQQESLPVIFIDQNTRFFEESFHVNEGNDRRFILHLARYGDILTVGCNRFRSGLNDNHIFIKFFSVVIVTNVEKL